MITPKELTGLFARNLSVAKSQTQGLIHADSILQPPFRGNCLNWVLGHVVDNRSRVLQLLGQPPLLSESQAKRYGYGSEPVCADGPDILKLETLMALLEQSQESIDAALGKITSEELSREVSTFMGPTTLGYFLVLLYSHESYHLGTNELLREMALAGAQAK